MIVYGDSQSGKSTLIDLVCKKISKEENQEIKVHKIYHKAYKKGEVFS